MLSHPRIRTQDGTKVLTEALRVLVYAPDPERLAWIESALQGCPVVLQVSRSVGELVAALTEDPPPRPQTLIADFAAMTAGELMHLHAIREQGWFGQIVALGRIATPLRESLTIEQVLGAPFDASVLKSSVLITTRTFQAQTVKIRKVP